MSVMVQANGAQREAGMYAGVSGAVRKLFDEGGISDLYGITGAEAGMQENVPFDISGYTFVTASVMDKTGYDIRIETMLIFPKQRVCATCQTQFDAEASTDGGEAIDFGAFGAGGWYGGETTISVSGSSSWSHRSCTYNPSDNTLVADNDIQDNMYIKIHLYE